MILHKRPRTFEEILRRSLNCDPAFLLTTLQELEDANLVSKEEGTEELPIRYRSSLGSEPIARNTQDAKGNPPALGDPLTSSGAQLLREACQEMLNSLPEPTPVYSQWWFSECIYENLVRLLLSLSKPRSPVAFIGASTLGALFSRFCGDSISIFDIDEILLKEIDQHSSTLTQVIHYNASTEPDACFKNAYNLVFVDPPWSSDSLRTFLVRSSGFVAPGGTLLFSLPPILTRPCVGKERKYLLKLAASLGLSIQFEMPGLTEYSVPPFEQDAYEKYGICLTRPWRRGDLFSFTKTGPDPVDTASLIEENPEWNQYRLGKRRLFLKRDGRFEDGQPSVKPIIGLEDLLCKSTSSRLAFWKSASLISSRNRLAHACGRKKLSVLLAAASKKGSDSNSFGSGDEITQETKDTILAMW
jgi:hypothetical protein